MSSPTPRSLHTLGVVCGLGAGAWLGLAEAPTKLVTVGFSPFIVSLGMVAGVFIGRWTVPMMLKGTRYVWRDLSEKRHLIVWAVLAGMMWAVANTLTVFAIRNVGLAIALPLWNCNSFVGMFWAWLLFRELRGAGGAQWAKVVGGGVAIVVGACLLALATTHESDHFSRNAMLGIVAALGAGLIWGTMYVPYRKAYISGMNPLSFVTVFTFGELTTAIALAATFGGGMRGLAGELVRLRPGLFWLLLGGFCWVIGDLFQQYAAKYIGISRGIPLSNTNQLWGLAWGGLVFGELATLGESGRLMVFLGSGAMLLGALAISLAQAPEAEKDSWLQAVDRECTRYCLDRANVLLVLQGQDPLASEVGRRRWWEFGIVAVALGIFVWLGLTSRSQALAVNEGWAVILSAASIGLLLVCGVVLWKRTRFS